MRRTDPSPLSVDVRVKGIVADYRAQRDVVHVEHKIQLTARRGWAWRAPDEWVGRYAAALKAAGVVNDD